MSDNEIREYLLGYITEEMNLLTVEEMNAEEHTFTKGFKRRINTLFSVERCFGKNINAGLRARRIAIAAAIIVLMVSINQVSAKVLGFNPWKYMVSYIAENVMNTRTYTDANKSDVYIEAVRDIPDNVPMGFTVSDSRRDDVNIYVEWKNSNQYIQYNRCLLSSGTLIAIDGEYDSKKDLELCGYECTYYVKGDVSWIIWNDNQYYYQIDVTNVTNPKDVLLEMGESLYK